MVLLVQGATLQGDNPWVYRVLMPMEAPAIVIIYAFAGALGLKSLAHPWITATLVNFFFYSLVFYLLLSAFAALARALRRP